MKYFSFGGGSINALRFIYSCDFTEHGTYYCTKIKIHIYMYKVNHISVKTFSNV